MRSFVSEKVKNFENCRTNVRNEAKESRRENTQSYSSECVVERKFASSSDKTRSVVGEKNRIGMENEDVK